jgi:hypothetical protein
MHWEYVLTCQESDIPLDGMAIRSSYRELKDSTIKTFMGWFGDIATWRESENLALIKLPAASDPKVYLEHIYRFRSLEKPEDVKKVQSFEGAFIGLDEVVPTFGGTTMRSSEGIPIEVIEITNSRLRHKWQGIPSHRYTQVIVANPPTHSHWLYKHYLAKDPAELAKRKGGVSIHFIPHEENVKNLPDDYYEILCDTFHDPDLVRRLVFGEIVTTWSGEAVFPEAKARNFTSEKITPVKGVPLILGWDYGLTPGTLITQLAPNGQWRWLSEVQNFNCAFDTHLEMVRAHLHDFYPGWEIRSWGDPAGAQRTQTDEKTCVEMAAAAGYEIKPGRQDWQARKESMKQRLLRSAADGEPGLLVSRSGCPLAAEGLGGAYRYPKSASGEIGTRPIKNHVSHLMDCAQMVATREFQINPQAFKPRPGEGLILEPPTPANPFRKPKDQKSSGTGSWLGRF